jgi:glutaredoxin
MVPPGLDRRRVAPRGSTHTKEIAMKQVYMYTLSTCPWCIGAERWFTERNIPFEYTDYDVARKTTQVKILAEMEAAGVSGFPFR